MAPALMRAALTAAALLIAPLAAAQDVAPPPMGDDDLHKPAWLHETFKDLREDLAEAAASDRRLMVLIEQRGCVYCKKMHEEVFIDPQIDRMLHEEYFVVQLNLYGSVEVTDFDGTTLPEKEMARRWGVLFTPTTMFFPEDPADVPPEATAAQAAVVQMPGAFERQTTRDMLNWVLQEGYESEETFQRFHARMMEEQGTSD